MKLTELKLRQLIREELNIQSRNQPPRYSVTGAIQNLLEALLQKFESELTSVYDIEFEEAYSMKGQVKVRYEVYNRRLDMMKEGLILLMEVDQKIHIEIRGGMIGGNLNDVIYEKEFGPSEDIANAVDIVSIFQIVAGRP